MIFKSEPNDTSIDHLKKAGTKVVTLCGLRN